LSEKARIVESAQGEIESIKQKNEKLVKDKAVDHIISGIKSILGEEITPEMNNRIIGKLTKS
jgi:F0F1-type ATP synthase membrane subunit b/b'